MPWSSNTSALARRARGCAAEPSRASSIRSRRDSGSRKPARIMTTRRIRFAPFGKSRARILSESRYTTSIRAESDEFGKRLFARMVEADRQVVDRVTQVAEARGLPRAQIALAWLLSKPVITAPIIGATKLQHLDDAVAAVSVKLTAEETATLEEAYVPHPLAGFG